MDGSCDIGGILQMGFSLTGLPSSCMADGRQVTAGRSEAEESPARFYLAVGHPKWRINREGESIRDTGIDGFGAKKERTGYFVASPSKLQSG